jgi:hypothetical protein
LAGQIALEEECDCAELAEATPDANDTGYQRRPPRPKKVGRLLLNKQQAHWGTMLYRFYVFHSNGLVDFEM